MKQIRKELYYKKPKEGGTKKAKELAAAVGWLDVVKTQWKIETKKAEWTDIHRDIVSTVR